MAIAVRARSAARATAASLSTPPLASRQEAARHVPDDARARLLRLGRCYRAMYRAAQRHEAQADIARASRDAQRDAARATRAAQGALGELPRARQGVQGLQGALG
ncbi:hypothetical protein EKD04_009520 [Chloroflexales bacterium ZM16-3]|nr:hypothetical protein [Chloroflexales bacterium ZM16-3]